MIKTYLFTKQDTREDVSLEDWKSLAKDEGAMIWVDVRSVKKDELDQLAGLFGLHPIALDSCLDGYRRPHLFEFGDHLYVNLTVIASGGHNGLHPSELNLFAGEKFIITVSKQGKSEAVDRALSEFKAEPKLCERGTIYAVYLLTEDLVETYFPVVEKLDDAADQLETEMLDGADQKSLKRQLELKRKVFELRKILGPQRDILNELSRRDFPFMQGENTVYFQDIYNRMIRLFDMLDTIREILSGSLDIYLSSVSNRLNEVMKVLTGVATILVILSVVTGFFGMNVPIPGQNSPWAWVGITGGMAAIVGYLGWYLHRKGWL